MDYFYCNVPAKNENTAKVNIAAINRGKGKTIRNSN